MIIFTEAYLTTMDETVIMIRHIFLGKRIVIFHAGDFNPKDLPEQRSENQRYVYYILETLPNGRGSIFFDPKLTDNYFNWTMSHRRDSDVYIAEPYGALRRKAEAVLHNKLPPYLSQSIISTLMYFAVSLYFVMSYR